MSTIDTTTALQQARAEARAMLATPTFRALSLPEQRELYRDTVARRRDEIVRNGAVATAMVRPAGQLIDDTRHENKGLDKIGDRAEDFIQAVNFPVFVRDLLKGVFDANLAVTIQQMETYGNLLKTATASVSKFVTSIDDTAAFGYLAENNSEEFDIDFSDDDEDKSPTNPDGMILTDKDGQKLDLGDNEVKAKIMDAKIAMAQEQRALLREMILMGVTRLVVERGSVKASVLFDFKGTEKIQKADKAATKESKSHGGSISASGGLVGSIFGGPRGGTSWSKQEAQVTVASAKSVAENSIQAKLTGAVDIVFKSDYFKLDNFAEMYKMGAAGGAPAPGGAAAPARLPAAVPPPAAAPAPAR